MTSTEQSVEASSVVDLRDPGSRDVELVGMKVANLALLITSGFRVPEGFVITTSACDRILSAPHVPDDLWKEIRAHLDLLGEGPWAIRSSGTAEDLADDSYAGLYETVLGVENQDAVADAIARCLASASSDRVRAYRGSNAPVRMAVLIQRMVPAEAAGVAFTANPITGDDEVLVSAVKGLGDRLVSGEATPDEWVARGSDVVRVRSSEGALDDNQAREIAELASAVEQLFGSPQDVEWAMANGEVFVLQARPITALPINPHLEAPSEGFWMKDTSHWPTPLTPFGASVYLPDLSDAKPPMAEFGLMVDSIEQRSFGGEVYVRAIPLGGKERPAPPAWAVKLAVRFAPPIRRRARAAEAAINSGLAEQYLDRWESEWRAAFAGEFRELNSVVLATLSDDALLEHLDRSNDLLRRGVDLHFRLVAPYDLALYELGVVCQELLGWGLVRALALLTGSSTTSSEPGRELRALAVRLAADAQASQALTGPSGDPLTSLRGSAPWAGAAFDDYLERYGHRTLNYDPGEPTWFERPDMVARLLIEQVRSARAESRDAPGMSDAPERARAELAGRSEQDRARFERVLAYAQRAYAEREDNVFWLDCQPAALLRYCAVEIGRRLAVRGTLAHAPDGVFLEEAELRRALLSKDRENLRSLVARRKAERAWVAAHPGPQSYGKDPGPPPDLSALPPALRLVHVALFQALQLMMAPNTPQGAPNELRGVPGSPGRYSGTVRIVRDETEFANLRPGDVLVAPVTSPPWSVLFLQAGAVVTDGGGVLSHTAVIAREYGIPAVLATGEATRRLRDGDLVSVDGNTGVVTFD
jgi:rifampicin phosphotransferase